jgi:mannose-6-phosphate isomerase-like protein (cupin superfamily)
MIDKIQHEGKQLAIIIREDFTAPGIHFFTPDEYSQQLAFMKHPVGKIIEPHVHNSVQREVFFTQEVLLLKKGRLRVDFYDDNRNYLESRILKAGDIILLAAGGHGFEALEEIEMIEVKQGPYAGDGDKSRFEGVSSAELMIKEETSK